ncbi:(2,3-dihydroxybenzoyl)adenylate synthase [Brucella abortus 90/50]|nr:(2,3-dihydroxybenzoyl)adenylate synthase [Brucella abortus 90/50]
MTIEFTHWPPARERLYREKGYWIDKPLTRALEEQAAMRPDAPAILYGERRFTYAELDRLSSNLASRLAAAGIGKGDTALVQLPNIAEFYIVFFALMKAGIAPVNALFSHRKLELGAYASQIEPRLLIGSRQHELFMDDAFARDLGKNLSAPLLTLFAGEADPASSLDHWIATPADKAVPFSPTGAGEVAFFQLSGGSTGTPKLIPRTHNDYDYSVRASAEICALTPQTRFLCALPTAHNYPMSSPGALGVFHAGGCVVMAPNPEPLNCFSIIERHGVNMVALVPPAVALWLQAAPDHLAALSSLKLVQVGGASFAEALARQVPQVLGCKLQQVFGMAEGLVNYTRLDDPDEIVFTTQGRPISPDDEIRTSMRMANPWPKASQECWPRAGLTRSAAIIAAPNIMRRSSTVKAFIIRATLSSARRKAICASWAA